MLPAPGLSVSALSVRRLRRTAGSLAIIAVATLASATAATDPWQAALNFDYNLAAGEFAQRHAAAPTDLRLANAYAASLFVVQPRTMGNLATARALLESTLIRATPADREHRILALYLLARLDHDHVSPPQLAAARTRYEQLLHEYPGHPLTDHAVVHLALLHALQTPDTTPATAITFVENLLGKVTAPSARRELHHLLAHLHWHGRSDAAAALPHYRAGREIGFEAPYRNGELDLTIASLATDLGQDALALRHYLAFAEAYPRDARTQTVRRLAAETEARLGTSP